MGRRKIEIKPIRDDRNRSVTFLKRKGGLFKKAHELSVLCSVDVAVVIFGHNKKLYEYSSSDINEIIGRFNYYGGAHEHKGPTDFADKQGGDDDDDDEGGEDVDEQRGTPAPDGMRHPQMQHHPGFQHVRRETPSGSPPMHNGTMPHLQRGPSPMPPGASRPSSRASQHPGHSRRTSSNLAHQTPPQHPPTTVPPPGSYAYMPNAPFYNQQGPGPASQRAPPQQGQPSQATYPPPYPPQGAHNPQMQALMMQDNRRSSMPPAIPPQPTSHDARHPSQDHHLQPPPHGQSHPSPRMAQRTPPQQRPNIPTPQPSQFQSPPMPQPRPLPSYAKSNIFTPIDDSRSMLAQHWGSSTNNADARQEEGAQRRQSVDASSMNRERAGLGLSTNGPPPPPKPASPRHPLTRSPRSMHAAAAPSPKIPAPLARSNTMQSSDARRPRLTVQIPSEASGDEAGGGGVGGGGGGGGAGSAPDEGTSQPSNTSSGQQQHHGGGGGGPSHGVVLPPPSPSASALLSAGAQGPPNPFARPAPPMSTNPHASNRDPNTSSNPNSNSNSHGPPPGGAGAAETPMSALPSRFVSDNLLPSPSTFYPEWGFGRSDNMLPSPLNFQTPVVANGQGWRGDDDRDREREREGRAERERDGGGGKRGAEGDLEGGEAGKKVKG